MPQIQTVRREPSDEIHRIRMDLITARGDLDDGILAIRGELPDRIPTSRMGLITGCIGAGERRAPNDLFTQARAAREKIGKLRSENRDGIGALVGAIEEVSERVGRPGGRPTAVEENVGAGEPARRPGRQTSRGATRQRPGA